MKIRLLIVLLACCVVSNAQNTFITDSLDAYVSREMTRWHVPGLALAVVKDGKVVVMKGYGVREVGSNKKVNENTLFQVASNTKAFTGTCISILNQQKRLSLDDKVTKWIPDFRLYDSLATREATVRDMLCHRIGFKTFQSDFLNWNCNLSRMDLILNMRNVKPEYSFRSRYGYTNMGFVVAGQVIKMVTDTTWEDYVKAHLLDPLSMNRTFTSWNMLEQDTNATAAYTFQPIFNTKSGAKEDMLVKIPHANVENIGPCASFNTSVKDLSNWLMMQIDSGMFNGKRVVPFSVLRDTWRSQTITGDPSDPYFPLKHFGTYGLGWSMFDYAGKKVLMHGGGTNGMVTRTMFIPEERLGIIVLTNTDVNDLYDMLAMQILESYLKVPYRNLSEHSFDEFTKGNMTVDTEIANLETTAAANPTPTLPVGSYAGRYSNEVYGSIDIRLEKKKLKIYFSHHPLNIGSLESLGGNDFLCTYSDLTCGIKKIIFTADKDKVNAVTIRVNDFIDYMPYDFKKVN